MNHDPAGVGDPGPRVRGAWGRWFDRLTAAPARAPLQIAVTAVLVAILLRFGYVSAFRRALGGASWPWVALAVPFGALSLQSHATRWWLTMRPAGDVPMRGATLILLVAGAIGDFVPLRAGAAFQVQITHRRYGIPRAAVAGTLAFEILLDVLVVAALATLAFPAAGLVSASRAWWASATMVAVAALLAAALTLRWLLPWALPERLRAGAGRIQADLMRGFATLARPRDAAAVLALTVANWLAAAAGYYFLARALALDLSPLAFVAMGLAVNLVAKISPSTGNIGTYEVAAQQTLVRFGAASDQAAAFAVGAHVAAMLGTLLLGVAAAWALGVRRRDVFYLARREPRPGG